MPSAFAQQLHVLANYATTSIVSKWRFLMISFSLGKIHREAEKLPFEVKNFNMERACMMKYLFVFNVWSPFKNSLSWRNKFFANKATLIWFSIYLFELSFVVDSFQCATLPLGFRIVLKNPRFITCDQTTKKILLIMDSVKKIKTLVCSIELWSFSAPFWQRPFCKC